MAAGDGARFRVISATLGGAALGFAEACTFSLEAVHVPLRPGAIVGPSHQVLIEGSASAEITFREASPAAVDASGSLVVTMKNSLGSSVTATMADAVAGSHRFTSGEPGSFTQMFNQKNATPAITYT